MGDDVLQQSQRATIGPVQVVEHDHDALDLREMIEQRGYGREQRVLVTASAGDRRNADRRLIVQLGNQDREVAEHPRAQRGDCSDAGEGNVVRERFRPGSVGAR